MMKILLSFSLVAIVLSCSSRKLQRDYKVVDSSHQDIPEWVSDLEEWVDDEEDSKKDRFYIYTTEAKNSRAISCEIANARSTSMVASEIGSFLKHRFSQAKNGDPTKKEEALSEYIEEDLVKEVESFIIGAQIYKTYWEKRRFDKELGAKNNWDGYVCTSLIKISKANLKKAFEKAQDTLVKKAKEPKVKADVKEILENAKKAYTQD